LAQDRVAPGTGAQKTMSLFEPMSDNDPSGPPEPDSSARLPDEQPSSEPAPAPLPSDPINHAATTTAYPEAGRGVDPDANRAAAYPPKPPLPEDLRISWSWAHFCVFMFFTLASFVVVQTGLAIYYAPHERLSPQQYEQYLLNKPQFLFGSNLIWYALIFLFLYVTLAVLRGAPFWSSLGWKKLRSDFSTGRGGPWVYFLSGCGLAIFVAVAGSQVHSKENMPIQELFKNRNTAILLMGMAVLVAPLVEETVFRGYLYPLFAKSFGIVPGVLLTGVLFGLMHGSQLGWTWGIVLLLMLVGVIFTFVRAHTGTVVASFLLHLGYNSMIAVTTIVSTHGFKRLPTFH
jgi:membrane protease YdiL (CAAX protease family)